MLLMKWQLDVMRLVFSNAKICFPLQYILQCIVSIKLLC